MSWMSRKMLGLWLAALLTILPTENTGRNRGLAIRQMRHRIGTFNHQYSSVMQMGSTARKESLSVKFIV
ncbi:MAG: hypothetical protein BWK72_18510 [Rhodoferax ferrireducens]|uniref:Uncharacterized protein n=1 Tax=Rhodoferax ferrireducens TaxID=192843 RepID=A0A1W9KPS8_9BURK|nr:MAG: hypothetical protein BWK72_18510 [Rhodoferax ferrireducens]